MQSANHFDQIRDHFDHSSELSSDYDQLSIDPSDTLNRSLPSSNSAIDHQNRSIIMDTTSIPPSSPLYDDDQAEFDPNQLIDTRQNAMLCLATLYIVITVIGFAGNAAVLYIIARSRRSKAVTSIYIFNLAIADLLYVVCLPAAVYPMLNGHWILGHITCKLYFTCDGVSKFASVMFLVVLSFDRYMAVCHPIASRAVRTAKVAFIASGASWLLVVIAMIPVFVHATLVRVNASGQDSLQCVIYWPAGGGPSSGGSGGEATMMPYGNETTADYHESVNDSNLDYYPTIDRDQNESIPYPNTVFVTGQSNPDWQRRIFTLYIFTLSFSAPLLLVWIFYIMIIHRLWSQKRNLFVSNTNPTNPTISNDQQEQSSSNANQITNRLAKSERAMLPANKANQRRRRSTKRVTIMVLSIVIAYTLCWIPYWCVQMTIEFFREDPALDFEIFTIISYIAYGAQSINSALNPFLYAFGTHAHRRRLLAWIRRCLRIPRQSSRASMTPAGGASSSGGIEGGGGGQNRRGTNPKSIVGGRRNSRRKDQNRLIESSHRNRSASATSQKDKGQFLNLQQSNRLIETSSENVQTVSIVGGQGGRGDSVSDSVGSSNSASLGGGLQQQAACIRAKVTVVQSDRPGYFVSN